MTMLPSSTPSSTPSPSNCPKCRGIRMLVSQKFCPACEKPLLELPQDDAIDRKNDIGALAEKWKAEGPREALTLGIEPYKTDVKPSDEILAASPEALEVMESKVSGFYPMRRNEPAAAVEKQYGLPPGYLKPMVGDASGNNLIVTLRQAMDSLKYVVHELEHWRCEAKNWRDVAEKLQQDTDFFHRVFGKRFHLDSVCGSCGGPLDCERDAICRRCTDAGPAEEEKAADAIADKLQNLRGPDGLFHEGVWNPVTEMYDRAPSTGETFTPAQMVAAIGQWMAFGERMLATGQQAGYYSGSGRAARALAAARDFIEKAGAE